MSFATTMYAIFCGGIQGGKMYETREEAQAAADLRECFSGKHWYVKPVVCCR